MNFIHAADLHLDAPLKGLARYEGAPHERIRQAGRVAFERLIEACLSRQVDFLLLAGDILDGSGRDFNTVLYLARHLQRLKAAGIEVFAVLGNHDAGHDLLQANPFSDNVHLFSSSRAQTHRMERLGVAIHGQSHEGRGEKRNLAAGYPAAIPGLFNIGLLHTALTGRAGHESYAPCTEQDLLMHGYHYWALGHIHQRELVRPHDPMILFPGTLQGRHIRESGAKGATLVEVAFEGDFRIQEQHLPMDQVRWHILEIDMERMETFNDLLEQVVDGMESLVNPEVLTVVRLLLKGRCAWQGQLVARGMELEQELRVQTMNTRSDVLWLERVINQTEPLRSDAPDPWGGGDRSMMSDPMTMVHQMAAELREDPVALNAVFERFKPLRSLLGGTAFHGMEHLPFHEDQWLNDVLRQAEWLLEERLRNPGGR
ncbi:MAG: DNA repair exonuclease [Magnetococcales bacterium]|nr:DNA repair exonuclease [Magnetococcales bacterium]